MLRRVIFFVTVLAVSMFIFGNVAVSNPVFAQDAQAVTSIETNIRVGPGQQYALITTLPTNTAAMIEARTRDTGWILIKTVDGTTRGWGKTRLFNVAKNIKLADFPLSTEILNVNTGSTAPGAPANPEAVIPPAPKVNGTSPLGIPNVARITPGIRSAMRAVLAKGKALGNNPQAFVKVGDCQTDHPTFLTPYGYGTYNLGEYGYLQNVINYFNVPSRPDIHDSWDARSVAARNGFNSSAVLQPEFNDPAICQAGERPITCEFRLTKPGIAIIMFGTADVIVMTPQQFYNFMSIIVKEALDNGVIPVLSTFPENPTLATKSRQMNQLVIRLAARYNLPVMNLADALKGLPNWGLEGDLIHLTIPPDGNAANFTKENLNYGYTVRNLIVLQSLDAIMRQILN